MAHEENAILDAADSGYPGVPDPLTDGTYVRFCRGLAVLAAADRVIISGGLRRRLFTGGDATRVATRLVPLLDGRRTGAEVCADSEMDPAVTRRAIAMLRSYGMVEYGKHAFRDDSRLPPHAAEFYSRAVHAGGGPYCNSQEAQSALASSAVLVLARGPVAQPTRAGLEDCGVGSVTISDATDSAAAEAAITVAARWPHVLVIGVEDPGSRQSLARAEICCRKRAIKFLRAARLGVKLELGPLFLGGHTACYECFSRGHGEFFAGKSAAPTPPADPVSVASDEALSAMITAEALALLGHAMVPQSYRTLVVTSLADYSSQRLTVFPYRDCPVCGVMSPGEEDAPGVYEWEVEGPPSSLVTRPDQAALARPDIAELIGTRSHFPVNPSYPLPASPAMGAPAGVTSTRLGNAELATVLARTGGRRAPGHPSDLSRWAPSGGNLASVRLYSVTAGSGFGVTAERLTVYDDMRHRLTMVRADRVPISELLEGTGLTAADPAAVIVFVADVARIAHKYSRFSYRLAHLDAGVAAAQLMVVARELGLAVTVAPTWSPGLADLLDLLHNQEFVTALALLTTTGGRVDAPDA